MELLELALLAIASAFWPILVVVDLIALMGYYDLVAMTLNVDRYPLPDGAALPFQEPN